MLYQFMSVNDKNIEAIKKQENYSVFIEDEAGIKLILEVIKTRRTAAIALKLGDPILKNPPIALLQELLMPFPFITLAMSPNFSIDLLLQLIQSHPGINRLNLKDENQGSPLNLDLVRLCSNLYRHPIDVLHIKGFHLSQNLAIHPEVYLPQTLKKIQLSTTLDATLFNKMVISLSKCKQLNSAFFNLNLLQETSSNNLNESVQHLFSIASLCTLSLHIQTRTNQAEIGFIPNSQMLNGSKIKILGVSGKNTEHEAFFKVLANNTKLEELALTNFVLSVESSELLAKFINNNWGLKKLIFKSCTFPMEWLQNQVERNFNIVEFEFNNCIGTDPIGQNWPSLHLFGPFISKQLPALRTLKIVDNSSNRASPQKDWDFYLMNHSNLTEFDVNFSDTRIPTPPIKGEAPSNVQQTQKRIQKIKEKIAKLLVQNKAASSDNSERKKRYNTIMQRIITEEKPQTVPKEALPYEQIIFQLRQICEELDNSEQEKYQKYSQKNLTSVFSKTVSDAGIYDLQLKITINLDILLIFTRIGESIKALHEYFFKVKPEAANIKTHIHKLSPKFFGNFAELLRGENWSWEEKNKHFLIASLFRIHKDVCEDHQEILSNALCQYVKLAQNLDVDDQDIYAKVFGNKKRIVCYEDWEKTDTNVIVLEDVLMNPEAYPLTGKIPLSAQAMKNSDEDLNKQCNLKRNSIIKELLESTKKTTNSLSQNSKNNSTHANISVPTPLEDKSFLAPLVRSSLIMQLHQTSNLANVSAEELEIAIQQIVASLYETYKDASQQAIEQLLARPPQMQAAQAQKQSFIQTNHQTLKQITTKRKREEEEPSNNPSTNNNNNNGETQVPEETDMTFEF